MTTLQNKTLTKEAIESAIKSFTVPFSAYDVTQKLRQDGYWAPHNRCRQEIRDWVFANKELVEIKPYDNGTFIYTQYTLKNNTAMKEDFPYKELEEFKITSLELQKKCLELQKVGTKFDYKQDNCWLYTGNLLFGPNNGYTYRLATTAQVQPVKPIQNFSLENLKPGEEFVVQAEDRQTLINLQNSGMCFERFDGIYKSPKEYFKNGIAEYFLFDIGAKYRRSPKCTFGNKPSTPVESTSIRRGKNGKFTIPKNVVDKIIKLPGLNYLEREKNIFKISAFNYNPVNCYRIDKSGNIRFRDNSLQDIAKVVVENNQISVQNVN